MTTMICLVSGQPMPNLRAALAPSLEVEHVVLAVSKDMEEKAAHLQNVLEQHDRKCRRLKIEQPYNYNELLGVFVKELEREKNAIVNVTGGTKPMAMALLKAADQTACHRRLYVREDTHKGMWIDANRPDEKLYDNLSIQDILDAHGYGQTDSSFTTTQAHRQLAVKWVNMAGKNDHNRQMFGLVNKIAYVNNPKKKEIRILIEKTRDEDYKKAEPFLEEAEKSGLLRIEKDVLVFPSNDHRKFVCGGWLETAVEESLEALKKKHGGTIQEIRAGVNLYSQSDNQNEVDVLVSTAKGLAVIECKTGHYKSNNKSSGPTVSDITYKISAQKKYGGLTTHLVWVSLHKVSDAGCKRAKEYDIHIIDGDRLGNLEQELEKLIL